MYSYILIPFFNNYENVCRDFHFSQDWTLILTQILMIFPLSQTVSYSRLGIVRYTNYCNTVPNLQTYRYMGSQLTNTRQNKWTNRWTRNTEEELINSGQANQRKILKKATFLYLTMNRVFVFGNWSCLNKVTLFMRNNICKVLSLH